MIIRKTITTILATLISIAFLSIVVFSERIGDLVNTVLFTGMVLSPYILFYGVPVTFFSDFMTKRFTGVKRTLLALVIHLLFGIIFPPLFGIFRDISSNELEIILIGSTTFAFFFWAIDEILRCFLINNNVINYEVSKSIRIKSLLVSYVILFIIICLVFTMVTFIDTNTHNRQNVNWDGVILFNILYSLGLALIFSPIGYLVIKTIYFKKNSI